MRKILQVFVCLILVSGSQSIMTAPAIAAGDLTSPLGVEGLDVGDAEAVQDVVTDWANAWVNGEMDKWDSYWAPNSVMYAPNHPPLTDGEKRALADKLRPTDIANITSFENLALAGRDDLAVVTFQLGIILTSGKTLPSDNYMVVLRKQDDDAWKIQAFMYNAGS
ncbi:DUF4440 domain-containing protein [Roseibium sp. RKSG952]|uniref:YybH family protein n=1 Tax=Roseibium sp. RKSG952 TaxID=2529384 RepID=UPI0012BD7F63|nr:nuclear transport factor 2 family protein [Roseibium sp. RKSG952]MTH95376.1 nuclear transport factor 2 family protein [Roseibium sp. RKSG952]